MHNLTEKTCPLMGQSCLLNRCTMFNEILENCEISILSYNMYQLKGHIQALNRKFDGVPESVPASDLEKPAVNRFPRPMR